MAVEQLRREDKLMALVTSRQVYFLLGGVPESSNIILRVPHKELARCLVVESGEFSLLWMYLVMFHNPAITFMYRSLSVYKSTLLPPKIFTSEFWKYVFVTCDSFYNVCVCTSCIWILSFSNNYLPITFPLAQKPIWKSYHHDGTLCTVVNRFIMMNHLYTLLVDLVLWIRICCIILGGRFYLEMVRVQTPGSEVPRVPQVRCDKQNVAERVSYWYPGGSVYRPQGQKYWGSPRSGVTNSLWQRGWVIDMLWVGCKTPG